MMVKTDDDELVTEEKPTTPTRTNFNIHQLNEDVILNILEFLDRTFVLNTLSVCSQQFHQLAHKPYHYSRLLWKFSFTNYERLDKIKPYYSAVKYIEASDSDRLTNDPIDESRITELVSFIGEHQETLKGVEMVFNKAQPSLFDGIAMACGEWLSELSISVLLDAEFAKYVSSGLHRFKRLKVLRLFIGKSVDANAVLNSCESMRSMETFETTMYLYSKEHVEKYCKFVRPMRNVSMSLNCEVFTDNNSLLELFTSCLLQGKEKISLHFYNVPSVSFLNKFRDVSIHCREMHISIVEMQNPDEVISLQKVQSFRVDHAALTANENIFPIGTKNIIFNPSSKFPNSIIYMNPTRFNDLTRIELSNSEIVINQHQLKNLEVIVLKECRVESVEAIIELSERLKMVHCISCTFSGSSIRIPKRALLTKLVVENKKPIPHHKFFLSALQELNLTALQLDSFEYVPEELHFLENMSSLEYLKLNVNVDMFKRCTIEKLTNLKICSIECSPKISHNSLELPVSYFANIEILKQALIILPPAFSWPSQSYLQLSEKELDKIILGSFDAVSAELRYSICNENYIYCVAVLEGTTYAFLTIENKAPFTVLAKRVIKSESASPISFIPGYVCYVYKTRYIYREQETQTSSSKCFIM